MLGAVFGQHSDPLIYLQGVDCPNRAGISGLLEVGLNV